MPSHLTDARNGLPAVDPRSGEGARFAMRFVTSVSLSDGPGTVDPMPTNIGTMTLLQLPDRHVGITCHHVIEAYRDQRLRSPTRVFDVGGYALDPLERLIGGDPILDLAVLDLDDVHPERLAAASHEVEFFEPPAWPLGTAEPGERVALTGYASSCRPLGADRELGIPIVGTTHVIDVGIENIICGLSSENRIVGRGSQGMDALADLGGLSGGPGFVWRGSELHLVGVMFAVAQRGDYLRLRPACFIRQDATPPAFPGTGVIRARA